MSFLLLWEMMRIRCSFCTVRQLLCLPVYWTCWVRHGDFLPQPVLWPYVVFSCKFLFLFLFLAQWSEIVCTGRPSNTDRVVAIGIRTIQDFKEIVCSVPRGRWWGNRRIRRQEWFLLLYCINVHNGYWSVVFFSCSVFISALVSGLCWP